MGQPPGLLCRARSDSRCATGAAGCAPDTTTPVGVAAPGAVVPLSALHQSMAKADLTALWPGMQLLPQLFGLWPGSRDSPWADSRQRTDTVADSALQPVHQWRDQPRAGFPTALARGAGARYCANQPSTDG